MVAEELRLLNLVVGVPQDYSYVAEAYILGKV